MFRAALREGTALGVEAKRYMDRGDLVPDELTIRMLLDRLRLPDARRGVILDGFPRTAAQAEALDAALAAEGAHVERAPYIDVPETELFRRLSGRWICRANGHPYHEQLNPPRVPGVCDEDGSDLYQRPDDRPEVVQARLDCAVAAVPGGRGALPPRRGTSPRGRHAPHRSGNCRTARAARDERRTRRGNPSQRRRASLTW